MNGRTTDPPGNDTSGNAIPTFSNTPAIAPASEPSVRASRPKTEKELADYSDLVENGLVRPTALEVYVMDADGKNIKQVTNFDKASFAPFFFPNGEKIIFSSNVNSENGRNFDLYTININGTNLEQITFNDTFDGFPIFTKDGKKLIFASNRFNKKKGDTNIFIADWQQFLYIILK